MSGERWSKFYLANYIKKKQVPALGKENSLKQNSIVVDVLLELIMGIYSFCVSYDFSALKILR